MVQPLDAPVADTRQQIVLLPARQKRHFSVEEALKDVADHVLAFLLVEKDASRHGVHFGIVANEQLLDFV